MTTAEAILHDLLVDESDWWAAELQTVTGFYRSEYEGLAKRMGSHDYQLTVADKDLLHGAAMGLIYCDPPYLEAQAVKSIFGAEWEKHIEDFMRVMRGK